jgi:hypothetical protein
MSDLNSGVNERRGRFFLAMDSMMGILSGPKPQIADVRHGGSTPGQAMVRAAGQVPTVRGRWRPAAVGVHEGQVDVVDEIGRAVERVSPGGAREVVVSGLQIGFPVEGQHTTARRPSLLPVPGHGLLLGCDGDGSIRRLRPAG